MFHLVIADRHKKFVQKHLEFPNASIDVGDVLRLNLAMLDRIADLEDELNED